MSMHSRRSKGFTLVEITVTLALMAMLAAVIMPITKTVVKREREIELRQNLRLIREALDAYKKLADEKQIEVEEDSEGYPPDLETLVEGVEVKAGAAGAAGTTAPGAMSPALGGSAGLGGSPGASSSKSGPAEDSEPKIVKFLRRIPRDPMTDSQDWGLRSYQDESDSQVWGGENVYDVYTRSNATALDGTKYQDW
jgi:general secretion pathway protein G